MATATAATAMAATAPAAPPSYHCYSRPISDVILSPTTAILGTSLLNCVLTGVSVPQPLPPELTHGIGDLLVTDVAARLPFAPHVTNSLNHAEALWDQTLQQQVISILRQRHFPMEADNPSWLSLLLTDEQEEMKSAVASGSSVLLM